MAADGTKRNWVGPVLHAGTLGQAVIAAIRASNPEAHVIDRGSYIRVLAPGPCSVTRSAIELHSGRRFQLPSDLEAIMPSFKGRLEMSSEQVVWFFEREGRP
jgi:hypothetical protein